MKIKVVSDLHLEFSDITINNHQGCDVLILSGDILVADKLFKEDSRIMLTANLETQTWSLVQFNDEYACLIEAGQGYHFGMKGT